MFSVQGVQKVTQDIYTFRAARRKVVSLITSTHHFSQRLVLGHCGLFALVLSFAVGERKIPVSDHVLEGKGTQNNGTVSHITVYTAHHNLSLHCDAKEDEEVEHENGPEDRDIEEGKQS